MALEGQLVTKESVLINLAGWWNQSLLHWWATQKTAQLKYSKDDDTWGNFLG